VVASAFQGSAAEWIGLLAGLGYIYSAYRTSNISWLFGLCSAICIIIVDIRQTHLYFDAILHGFFAIMAFTGLFLWYDGSESKKKIRISRMPLMSFILYIVVSALIAGVAGYLLDTQTDAVYPYLDCFQMMLSIFATFLVIYCMLDAWWYWIIVDLISISLYIVTGAYLLALLYLCYLISNSYKGRQWYARYQSSRNKL